MDVKKQNTPQTTITDLERAVQTYTTALGKLKSDTTRNNNKDIAYLTQCLKRDQTQWENMKLVDNKVFCNQSFENGVVRPKNCCYAHQFLQCPNPKCRRLLRDCPCKYESEPVKT